MTRVISGLETGLAGSESYTAIAKHYITITLLERLLSESESMSLPMTMSASYSPSHLPPRTQHSTTMAKIVPPMNFGLVEDGESHSGCEAAFHSS